MELYPFNALLARMKYIARWGLMRAALSLKLSLARMCALKP